MRLNQLSPPINPLASFLKKFNAPPMKTKTVLYTSQIRTPAGLINITTTETHVTRIEFTKKILTNSKNQKPKILTDCETQLTEYFAGKRQNFDLQLELSGTEFQNKVWKALQKIKFGKTASYKDIAEKINSPKGFRAVGMANNKNRIPIIIPCHRIIGTNGDLVGYAGGLKIKQALLDIEKTK